MTLTTMFGNATWVVKIVMSLLAICSLISWIMLIMKMMDFGSLNRVTSNFLEAYRGARSIADINRISVSDEFAGNPLADMAAVGTEEVQLSKQAGLQISGEHKDSTLTRAQASVAAVQAGLAKRLSAGLWFLASVGSTGPFVGLFGTVYGIMNSFINIANTHTTNLAVVAPGIAEALMATGLGLIAAIPAVVMYNIFNTSITNYGTRSEQFVSELMNSLSRQLDKGA
jgi:biopolymer transport protein ExbB